jgi:hypothetical protein
MTENDGSDADQTFSSNGTNFGDELKAEATSLAVLVHKIFVKFLAADMPKTTIANRWRAVLGVPRELGIYEPLSMLERSVNIVIKQLEDLPDSLSATRENGKDAVVNFKHALEPNSLTANLENLRSTLTDERLARLAMVAEILDAAHRHDIVIAEGIVPKILSHIDGIQDQIATAGFSPHIEEILYHRVRSLRWAIVNWHLLGGEPVTQYAGALALSTVTALPTLPANSEAGEKFREGIMTTLDWIGRLLLVRDAVNPAVNAIGFDAMIRGIIQTGGS